MGAIEEGEQGSKLGPPVVTLPSRKSEELPSLKLEVEDPSENMNPRNMWQVYALGGFLILRWAWARWKERKAKQGPSDGAPSSS